MVKKSKLNKHSKKFIPIVVGVVILIVLVLLLVFQLFSKQVEAGDTVSIYYTGYYENGSVFDTNVESVALQNGIEKESFQLFTFTLGTGQVIPGFEENILNIGVGEKKTFTVPPDKAYGEIKEELFISGLKRDLDLTRYSVVPLELYGNLFEEAPEVGEVVNVPDVPWDLTIVEINDTSVRLENNLVEEQEVPMSGVEWMAVVFNVTEDTITIRQNPEIGDKLAFPTPQGFLSGVVNGVSEDTFDVNANHPLAGISLTFEVELKELVKAEG